MGRASQNQGSKNRFSNTRQGGSKRKVLVATRTPCSIMFDCLNDGVSWVAPTFVKSSLKQHDGCREHVYLPDDYHGPSKNYHWIKHHVVHTLEFGLIGARQEVFVCRHRNYVLTEYVLNENDCLVFELSRERDISDIRIVFAQRPVKVMHVDM